MSFRRHGEIYRSDKKAVRSLPGRPRHCTSRPPQPHRLDEFPAGYSLAGCSPAEPASASPAGWHLAGRRLRSTIKFQRTANSVLTVCLSPGDNPMLFFACSRLSRGHCAKNVILQECRRALRLADSWPRGLLQPCPVDSSVWSPH